MGSGCQKNLVKMPLSLMDDPWSYMILKCEKWWCAKLKSDIWSLHFNFLQNFLCQNKMYSFRFLKQIILVGRKNEKTTYDKILSFFPCFFFFFLFFIYRISHFIVRSIQRRFFKSLYVHSSYFVMVWRYCKNTEWI